jgi:hypothetical protein
MRWPIIPTACRYPAKMVLVYLESALSTYISRDILRRYSAIYAGSAGTEFANASACNEPPMRLHLPPSTVCIVEGQLNGQEHDRSLVQSFPGNAWIETPPAKSFHHGPVDFRPKEVG